MDEQDETAPRDTRAERVQQLLTVPVLAAALVSVPAVFLTTTSGTTKLIGVALNWMSLAVLFGESAALLWASGSIRTWMRRYRAQLTVLGVAVPAVVLAVGPVQILRLLFAVGAFRILRVGRIVRAGRVINRRLRWQGRRARWLVAGAMALALVFVGIVLADPESRTRRVIEWLLERAGVAGTVLIGLAVAALASCLVVAVRHRARRPHGARWSRVFRAWRSPATAPVRRRSG
jgi:hypothetical protein